MNKVRAFLKKYPFIPAILGIVVIFVAVGVLPLPKFGALTLGIREAIAAVIILTVYGLLMRPRDLRPDFTGFSYGFKTIGYLLILQGVLGTIGILSLIKTPSDKWNDILLSLLNALIACAFVGIVEEFTFRGMVFGGLASCFGRTKKRVLGAAILSAFAFGFIHVAADVFSGHTDGFWAWIQVVGKTVEAGLFGLVIALIYFRTRSIWTVVLLHGLNDLLLFLTDLAGESGAGSSYVANGPDTWIPVCIYALFSLLTVPALIRVLRDLKNEPDPLVLPFDDDFVPRKITSVKKPKK